MSIEEATQIDIIRIDSRTGNIVLDITDHLDWSNENDHLLLLQNKLNSYLNFLKSGQLYEDHPDFKGKKFVINVVFKNAPTPNAINFLQKVVPIVSKYGFGLEHMVYQGKSK